MRLLEIGMGKDVDYIRGDLEELRKELDGSEVLDRLIHSVSDEEHEVWLRAVGGLEIRAARTQRDLERVQLAAPSEFAVGLVHGRLLFHTGEGQQMIKRMPSITRVYVQLEIGPALSEPLLETGHHASVQASTLFDQLEQENEEYLEMISIGLQTAHRSMMFSAMEAAPTAFALGVVTAWVLMRMRIQESGGTLFE